MNVQELIEAFRNGLMHACLWALAALAVCALLLLVPKRKQVRPVFARIPPVQCVVLVVVMAVCTLFSGKNTNSPPAGIMSPILPHSTGGTPVVPVTVTPEEIAQGWRLESVTTNDAVSYVMPTNGIEYTPWSLGGGYEAHFPLDLGDFAFPFRTGVVHRLDVLSGGMVESLPRLRAGSPLSQYSSMMSICAAREYASIVPGVGRCWWADAAGTAGLEAPPYRVKLISWENLFGGRDRTGQYSAQIELHDDGNYITRSNNVESVYRRVHPHDLDNDGLPNIIDPAPEVPIVPSAWNQSEAWAAAAFPSNTADIASAGGYAAWAAERGTDPDRRLVSLGITFDDGSAWPALLDFDGIPVMVDGRENLAFAIDCGAKVSFSLTSGRLGSVTVTATEPPMRSGEGMTTTDSCEIHGISDYPHERMVGDVRLHLEGPRSGWLCHIAGMSVEPSWLPHLFPGDSAELTATVSDCHPDAYLGCTWHGGEGITFSDPNSLSVTVTYDSASTVEWSTNGIDLITQFVGYSLTNHVHFTVGTTNEPNTEFSISCPHVIFLNDLHNGKRAERVYCATLRLFGPHCTTGQVSIASISGAELKLFHDEALHEPVEGPIPIGISEEGAYEAMTNLYLVGTTLGNGMLKADAVINGGETITSRATCRVIEPIRRLVTTEGVAEGGRFVNPSCLVYGTNAVLKVGVNTGTTSFSPDEVKWRVVSGPGEVFPTNGLQTVLTPTADSGTVIVEARFNDDEIQPRFVLPIVSPMTINVRAFVVEPPESLKVLGWGDDKINRQITTANEVFTQVGIRFNLLGIEHGVGSSMDWVVPDKETITGANGVRYRVLSTQAKTLFANSPTNTPEIAVFFTGSIKGRRDVRAFRHRKWIVVGHEASMLITAHELGHVLGLDDCYTRTRLGELIAGGTLPVHHGDFEVSGQDWWHESGRGFYSLGDEVEIVAEKMLMFGLDTSGCDIPGLWFKSLRRGTLFEDDTVEAPVGAMYIKRNPEEVYSR